MFKKKLPAKRPLAFDSSSDEELFELTMAKKAQKVEEEVEETIEIGFEDMASREEKKTVASRDNKTVGSQYLDKLLQLKQQRDLDHKRTQIALQRKNAKGEVFESEEYKTMIEELGVKSVEPSRGGNTKVTNDKDKFADLAKSRVTPHEIDEARKRFFERRRQQFVIV